MSRPAQTHPEHPLPEMPGSLRNHFREVTDIQRALCFGDQNLTLLASTLIHEADHLCHSITGEWNPDWRGNRSQRTDECHATGTERNCGFSPDPVTISTGCL